MLRRTTRLAAAVVLTAAAGLVTAAPPASAAACDTASGVTVVVDFHELGGGVQQVCDASGAGKYAAAQFGDAGFSLERVQRQPGFVCRVDGAPSEDPCVNTPPADAYWGLWWSNGTSGSWTYSSVGVDSLKVPAGGSVALSWNGGSTKSPPGAKPPARASASPSPSPSPQPSQPPSSQPGGSGGTPTATPDPTEGAGTDGATPSAGPSDDPTGGRSGKARPGKRGKGDKKDDQSPSEESSPSTDPSDTAAPAPADATADPPPTDDGGLPTWTGPAAIGALFVAAGGTALVRRRRSHAGAGGP